VLDITTRQQIQLRGFELGSVTEIRDKPRGVDPHSLQTGMDNVRNINGCALSNFRRNVLSRGPSPFANGGGGTSYR
jgi:ferredoxin-nitrite reductase